MVLVDEFESQFKRAIRPQYEFESIDIESILLVFDCDQDSCGMYQAILRDYLKSALERNGKTPTYTMLDIGADTNVSTLALAVESHDPDLVITRRHLFMNPQADLQGLGLHVDVLTQATNVPVMLVPRFSPEETERRLTDTGRVMVLSENLACDSHLVSYGVALTQPKGSLYLIDFEDDAVFERYMRVIEKIPDIDSTLARKAIEKQLLKESHEFQKQCVSVLQERKAEIDIHGLTEFAHTIPQFREVVDRYNADLLIFNTKDESQLAMHGMAYSIAVEFFHLPLLML